MLSFIVGTFTLEINSDIIFQYRHSGMSRGDNFSSTGRRMQLQGKWFRFLGVLQNRETVSILSESPSVHF